MPRYHTNPDTGNPNQCRAKEGNCPFKTDDGSEKPHYSTKEEARAGYEQEQKDAAAAALKEREEAKERNWPTPSQEAMDALASSHGYNVSSKRKNVHYTTELNGQTADIDVRSGELSAYLSMPGHFGAGMRIQQVSEYEREGGDANYITEFNDFGTQLSIERAEDHVKEMEAIIKTAPSLIEESNKMLKASEALFDRPKKENYPIYGQVEPLAPPAAKAKPIPQKFTVTGGDSQYPNYDVEGSSHLQFGAMRPSTHVDFQKNISTSISMPSASQMNFEEYQERAQKLRVAIETAKAMESDYKKRNNLS